MKRKLLIFLVFGLTLIGCETNMDNFKQHIDRLTTSDSGSSEQQNAVALNDYATEQHISYSLEIRRRTDSSLITMGELDKVLGDELNVAISVNDNEVKAIWKPIDNNNIFILLRE